MSDRRIGFLALGVVGVLSASALLVIRRESVEEPVHARADESRADSAPDSQPEFDLESLEPPQREGRMPAVEDRGRSTGASGDRRPDEPVATAPTYPVEMRALPESSLAELTLKRDTIQEHLTVLTEPIFDRRFREGKFERVTRGKPRASEPVEGQRSDISSTRVDKSPHSYANLHRTTLPRSEFPDLYILQDEVERLNRSIEERVAVELRALPESSLAEITVKRDAVQQHVSKARADPYFLKDEVERLNGSIQERAIADYHARKAAQAMEAPR